MSTFGLIHYRVLYMCEYIYFLVIFVCNRNSQFCINILACQHLIDTRKSFSLVLYVVLLCFIQVKICEPGAIQFYTDTGVVDRKPKLYKSDSEIWLLYLWINPLDSWGFCYPMCKIRKLSFDSHL